MEREKKPSRGRNWVLGILAVVLTCLYPCVFLFAQNAGEARAADMLPFFLVFLGTAAAGMLAAGVILRNVCRAAVMTVLGMLAVIWFSLAADAVEAALPWFYSRYLLILVCLILLGALIWMVRRKPQMAGVCGIIALTFGVLTAMSLVTAAPKLMAAASYDPPRPAEDGAAAFQGEKRNVYYLLFDEYGGDENLRDYFGFDNRDFYAALEERGFSVSHSSYNTESLWTDTLAPNMLNLDYVATDEMPEKVRRSWLEEPMLTKLFQDNGYQINLINHRAFLRLRGAKELTKGQLEDNISELLFQHSIFSKLPGMKERFTTWMNNNYRDNYRGPLENAIQALEGCAGAVGEGPTLTVSYIQCPHAPFVYDADGGAIPPSWNWKDEGLYPGQLQYINSVILKTVDDIQKRDPEAVILLLSDHGARVPLHMVEQFGGPRFDAAAETHIMQSALCCVYVPGTALEIEGDTAINATRKVLDAAFGTSLGTVEPPEGYVLDEKYNAKLQ